ncbi:DUF3644 domain-containing protein [Hansschlegelia sp. KR7-227]|uniref:DUF3644 domain-containing protein n=1 Tax=Hansschlegelia sp. KR7-227 TaxID=3400914 RepID=UPI003BFC7930
MKKEAKTLHGKAVDSLVVAVDHFNRAWDRGRTEAVLIMLDRAFELLLKAIIIHKGGDIREKAKEGTTIGFDYCLRKCLSDAALKCLDEDEAVALQSLNTLRDAAQHHMIEVSEEQLYIHAQSGITLFTRLAGDSLGCPLRKEIPHRILPVCAKPPTDLSSMFDVEFADIKKMVAPGSRKRLDASARLRSMAIIQASLDGKKSQPSDRELSNVVRRINKGEGWRSIFPGVATLTIQPDEAGPGLTIRVMRNQGEAVQIVEEGDPNATVIAVRKVNELDYYNMGLRDMSKKLDASEHKLLWIIRREGMLENLDHHKIIKIGGTTHKRYSGKCLKRLRELLAERELHEAYANRNSPR